MKDVYGRNPLPPNIYEVNETYENVGRLTLW